MGMIGVDKIGQIRRAFFERHLPIKEIVRTLSVSRATVRKVIRGKATEFGSTGCGFLKAGEFGCKPLRSWDFCWRAEFGVNPIAGRPEWPKVGTGNAISS